MTVQKDNIYEFGFGRSDQVSKNVNLLDEAVFSFLYGGLFKVLKSLALTSLLDLEIVAIVLGVAIFAVGLILLVSQSDTPKAGIPIPILIPTAEKPIAGTFNIGKLFF